MSEREHHIKALENLLSHYKAREKCEGYYDSTLKDNIEALEYALSSLKTDEAYQLMYEGGEVFTKDEVVDMLEKNTSGSFTAGTMAYDKLIQQKIDKLKENKDEEN